MARPGKAPTKRGFGQITRLPSSRYRARYTGPDAIRHAAPYTFETREDAEAWLAAERRLLTSGDWLPPKTRHGVAPLLFGDYATAWLERRELKPRTLALYRSLLERQVLPTFGEVPIKQLTPGMISDWWHKLDRGKPTQRAHAYGLLSAILSTAVREDMVSANPCRVKAGGSTKRLKGIRPATPGELVAIAENMPAPYAAMVPLAAWCSLRVGEVCELRRKDLDLTRGVVHVRRGVTKIRGHFVVGAPKSEAGVRDVAIPPHLIPLLREHRDTWAQWGREGLLFPASDGETHLAGSTLHRIFAKARDAAGRPDLRFHDLRHTGATMAAQTGATVAELMARLGHSSPSAAMRYQHAASERDQVIAQRLSELAGS